MPLSEVFNIDCMEGKRPHHWTGRKHSDETKQKMRDAMLKRKNPMTNDDVKQKRKNTVVSKGIYAGEKNNKWIGGGRKYRGPQWAIISEERRKLDNYTCQSCGKKQLQQGRKLDVHHIIDFRDGGKSELSNLQTLCRSCHNSKRKRNA